MYHFRHLTGHRLLKVWPRFQEAPMSQRDFRGSHGGDEFRSAVSTKCARRRAGLASSVPLHGARRSAGRFVVRTFSDASFGVAFHPQAVFHDKLLAFAINNVPEESDKGGVITSNVLHSKAHA